jgi:hypothetical protein
MLVKTEGITGSNSKARAMNEAPGARLSSGFAAK